MSTFIQSIHHIIFSTKYRKRTLTLSKRDKLYRYIAGIIKNKQSYLYAIGGYDDHIHILTSIHQEICLSDFIKDIKVATSLWIKKNRIFEAFEGWQDGYASFTYSTNEIENIKNYIKNQDEHHKIRNSKEELIELLNELKIKYDINYI